MKKIAIIGAPGSGKTTIAAGLFYNLKTLRKKTEFVPELIKYKVYKKDAFNRDGFDIQNSLEQRDLEETIEKAPDIEYVICEAPLCNGFFYSSFYKKDEEWPILKKIAQKNINTYDIIFFVEHLTESSEYESFGRKESKELSLKLQSHIDDKIKELNFKNPIVRIKQDTDIQEVIKIILDPESYLLTTKS